MIPQLSRRKALIYGMVEALELFNIKEGTLVTISQKDQFEKNGKVIPAHEYLLK